MKAAEITDALIGELASGPLPPRARQLSRTATWWATPASATPRSIAVEAVDLQIGRLLPVIEKLRGALVVTADHGNADDMFEVDAKTGHPKRDATGRFVVKTSHTLNPVPCHIWAPDTPCGLPRASNDPASRTSPRACFT